MTDLRIKLEPGVEERQERERLKRREEMRAWLRRRLAERASEPGACMVWADMLRTLDEDLGS